MAASSEGKFAAMHTLTLELPDDIYEPLLH